ncbi:MAG: trigger factor [Thermoleophilia bacterium]|nr:trigger factor [Thermoleophilia bacterium]
MEAQVEELSGNRVRLTVDVPPHDVEHAVEHAAADLAASARIPGFRKGKVPRPVLISRVGRERLYQEAVDSHIGGWFAAAAARSRVRPVAQPQFDFELPDSDREPWRFTATFDVQPPPELPDWTTLEVPRAEPEVPAELVEAELEALRRSVAELAPVTGRGAQEGDTLVVDLVDADGEERRDFVLELGTGTVLDELEERLLGMREGETREVRLEVEPEGAATTITATVKEIKEPVLAPVDDELARSASEFETLAELRAEIDGRLRQQLEYEAEGQFRQAVADALVARSQVEPAATLVDARTRELVRALARSLERRGLTLETYLQLSGASPDDLVERLRGEARQALARELVLEAVADRLGIEVADGEVDEFVREQAEAAGDEPDEILARVREGGATEGLRDDLRLRAALDRVAAEVKPIPVEVARARESIWTPEQEKPETPAKLWTPSSKEPA